MAVHRAKLGVGIVTLSAVAIALAYNAAPRSSADQTRVRIVDGTDTQAPFTNARNAQRPDSTAAGMDASAATPDTIPESRNSALSTTQIRWQSEARDPTWSLHAEEDLRTLYRSIAQDGIAQDITCHLTLCRVIGQAGASRSATLATDLQSRRTADRLAAANLQPSSSVIGGPDTANGRFTIFYTRAAIAGS